MRRWFCLHVISLAGISAEKGLLLCKRKKVLMSNPREGEQQDQMPRWQMHMLIKFASPEVGKGLLHLGYLTVTSRLSFADLGLPALRVGADIATLRHSVGQAQARVRACLRVSGQDERALFI